MLEGGWPVARCPKHPEAEIRERETMAETEERAIVMREPTEDEVNSLVETLSQQDFKFLSADWVRDGDRPAAVRLLAEGARRHGLDPLKGEIMLLQGRPYVTIDGRLKKARRAGLLDFIVEVVPPLEFTESVEQNTPPRDDEEEERFYWAAVAVKLKGWREPVVYCAYITESERQKAKDNEIASAKRQRKEHSGKFFSPLIVTPQKMAAKRARMKAIRETGADVDDSGLSLPDQIMIEAEARAVMIEAGATPPELEEDITPSLAAAVNAGAQAEGLPARLAEVDGELTPAQMHDDGPGATDAVAADVAAQRAANAENDPQTVETTAETVDPGPDGATDGLPAAQAALPEKVDEQAPPASGATESDSGADPGPDAGDGLDDPPADDLPAASLWEPLPDFELEILTNGGGEIEVWNTITAAARGYSYGSQSAIATALLMGKRLDRASLDEYVDVWSVRAVAKLLADVAGGVADHFNGRPITAKTGGDADKLTEVALRMQAENLRDGTGAVTQHEDWQAKVSAAVAKLGAAS